MRRAPGSSARSLLALTGLRPPRAPRRPGVGRARRRLALVALAMLALTFTPAPVANANFAQITHLMKHGSR